MSAVPTSAGEGVLTGGDDVLPGCGRHHCRDLWFLVYVKLRMELWLIVFVDYAKRGEA